MKLFSIFFSSLLISSISNAQLTKGNWLVGGNLSYNNTKYNGSSSSSNKVIDLRITPNIGYFIIDQLAAGIKVNAGFITEKYLQPDGTTTKLTQNSIGFGPFVRYYFLPTEKKINIVSEGGLIYTTSSNNSTSTTSKAIDYSFFSGPVIFFNPTVGIEFLLGYDHYKGLDVDYNSNAIQFKIGLQIHLEKP